MTNELATPTETERSPATLAVIQRAASDPACDVDKLERLMAMHERFVDREARAAYTEAMARMQPNLPSIVERGKIKDRSGNVQSTYALWEDINAAIKPILQAHGFALSFRTSTQDASVTVVGILSHCQGHKEETEITLPADTSGSKNSVQSVGSSFSYGKRYTASALLNITTHGEDDDGRLGGGKLTADDLDWIDRANHLEHPQEYQDTRKAMLDSYGAVANVPREVREAFNRAKARTTPKD